MTRAMKSLASIVKSSLRAGLKVSFTEEELKVMGIKVPKSKQHLIKPPQAASVHKPYNVFVGELLATAVR